MKTVLLLPIFTLVMAMSGCVSTRTVYPPDEAFLPESDPRKIKHCTDYYFSKSGWALCEILQSNSDKTCNTGIRSVLNDRGLKCDIYLPARKTSQLATPAPPSNQSDLRCKSKYSSLSQNQLCSTYWNNEDAACDSTLSKLIVEKGSYPVSDSCRSALKTNTVPTPPSSISSQQCRSKYDFHKSTFELCRVYWNNLDSQCDQVLIESVQGRGIQIGDQECKEALQASAVTPKKEGSIKPPAPQRIGGKDSSASSVEKKSPKLDELPNNLKLIGSGSSFLVEKNKLITNHHVTDKCAAIVLKNGDDLLLADVTAQDQRFDLSLLKVDKSLGAPRPIREAAQLGEEIMTAGYPLANLLSRDVKVTSGEVSSLAGISNDSTTLQISAPIQPGNSGGPILDAYGNIVGVVSSKLNDKTAIEATGGIAQNVNFAIKPEILRLFLSASGVSPKTFASKVKLERTDLADKASKSTFQIFCLGNK